MIDKKGDFFFKFVEFSINKKMNATVQVQACYGKILSAKPI